MLWTVIYYILVATTGFNLIEQVRTGFVVQTHQK